MTYPAPAGVANMDARPSPTELLRRIDVPTVPRTRRLHARMPPFLAACLAVSVLMAAATTGLMLWAGLHLESLVIEVRERQHLKRHPPLPPLPPTSILLDRARFDALIVNPGDLPRLLLARADALFLAERWDEAATAFAEARNEQPAGLPASASVDHVLALWRAQRRQEASVALDELAWASLPEADRARAVDVIGRMALADRDHRR